jgi:antitoxin component of MazEF toxin-antitoxin module
MKREFDGKIRKVGNSFVVTIPINTVERYGLKENEFITVLITDEKIIEKRKVKK